MKSSVSHRLHRVAAGIATLLLSCAAQAQHDGAAAPQEAASAARAAAPAPASTGTEPAAATLDEVTVRSAPSNDPTTEGTGSFTSRSTSTATGLSLSPRETPQSVSVITRDRIEAQGMHNLSDAIAAVPGVHAAPLDSRGETYSSRGFGINTIQIDGIPMTWGGGWDSGETRNDLVFYDRVEVVRGATGLLSGAGDPSAAINMIRKHADSPVFAGRAQVELGSLKHRAGMLDLSTPLNADASVRARLVGKLTRRDTYNDREGTRTKALYGVIDADLSARTRLSAGADWQDDQPHGTLWGGLQPWYSDGTRVDWPRGHSLAPRWATWPTTQKSLFTTLTHQFNDDWSLRLHAQHIQNHNGSKLAQVSGIPDRATGAMLTSSRVQYDVNRRQSDLALQVQGAFHALSRRHDVVLGGQLSHQRFKGLLTHRGGPFTIPDIWNFQGDMPEPERLDEPVLSAKNRTEQRALYAATRLHLAEPLRLIVGARITDWKRVGDKAAYNEAYVMHHAHEITPYAGLVLDLNDTWSAYASATRIFNPQQRRDRHANYLAPLEGQNLELGVKAAWLNGRLNGSAAVFRTTQDNFALADGSQLVPGSDTEQAYVAAKGVKSQGYELELVGSPKPGWDLGVGWTQFTTRDAKGQPVNTNRPNKLFKLFTQYRLPGAWNKLSLGAGLNWQGDIHKDVKNPVTGAPERLEQRAYALLNLSARYDFSPQMSARLAIHNALDKAYWANVGFYDRLTWGAPRTVMLTLDARF